MLRKKQLPDEVRGYRPSNYIFKSPSSFKDSWNVDNIKSLPNTGISFTTAKRFKAGRGNVGLLLSLNQSNQYQYKEGENNLLQFAGSNIVYNNKLLKKRTRIRNRIFRFIRLGI